MRYLTAKELNVHPTTRAGLLTVLRKLRNGKIAFYDRVKHKMPANVKCAFNMSIWHSNEHDCGTVGCIGGWAEHYGASRVQSDTNKNSQLYQLFYPENVSFDGMKRITIKQAIRAITRFLETGKTRWPKRVYDQV